MVVLKKSLFFVLFEAKEERRDVRADWNVLLAVKVLVEQLVVV